MAGIAGMMGGGGMGTSAGAAWITVGARMGSFNSGMASGATASKKFIKAAMGIYAVVAAVRATTSAFIEFDRQLKNTWTLLDDSEKQMARTGNSVRAMARQYQTGAADAQEALYHIVSATFYSADAMHILEEATKGAAAGLATLGATGDMLTTVLNAYRMSASETAKINDYLFTAIRYGKCLRKGSLVLLADGRLEKIENLSDGAEVISLDGDKFVPAVAKWVDQGTKPIVRIETKLGRRIDTTLSHPYLTPDGWKKVSELSVGDKVAVPTHLPFFGTKHVPKEEAGFLGLWIAEGYVSEKGSPAMGSNDYGSEIEGWAKYFGCTHTINRNNKYNTPVYSIVQGHGNFGSSPNPCKEFLKGHGVAFGTAIDKHIPDDVFSWDKESIRELLHWMFNGDGSLSRHDKKKYKHQLKLKSKSEKLIRQASHLLLRFGIVGHVRELKYTDAVMARLKKPNNGKIWVWQCERSFYIRRFVEQIGIDRPCAEEALNVRLNAPKLRGSNKLTYNDAEKIRSLYGAGDYSQREIAKMFGIKQQQVSKIVNRIRWDNEGSYPESTEIKQAYIFDAIKKIEEVGDDRVYDLVVPGLQNFVAEDVVAHNTTMSELASQMGRLSGVAAPVGASFSDVTAAVATLTRQGIRTDWAITSLRQTLMQFIKPVKNLKAAIESLGYTSGAAIIKAEGFAGALKLITEYAAENGIEMEQMFTNVRAITAVLPLATTAAGEYAKDLERMANSSGAATAAFEKQTKSWSFQIQKFTTLLNDFAISLGELLMPAIKGLMKFIEKLTDALRPVMAIFKWLGGDILIGVVATIGAMAAAVWLSVKAWQSLSAAIAKASVSMGIATGATAALTKAQAASSAVTSWYTTSTAVSIGGASAVGAGSVGFLAGLKKSIGGIISKVGGVNLLGAGLAAAFSIKTILDLDLQLGEVSGVESTKRAVWGAIKAVLGGTIAGLMLGSGTIGAAVAGAAFVIKIIHEVYVNAQEEAATTRERAVEVIEANIDLLPSKIGGGLGLWNFAEDLAAIDNEFQKLDGSTYAMKEALMDYYDSIGFLGAGGHELINVLEGATLGAATFRRAIDDLTGSFDVSIEEAAKFSDRVFEIYKDTVVSRNPAIVMTDESTINFVEDYVSMLNRAFDMGIDEGFFREMASKFSGPQLKEIANSFISGINASFSTAYAEDQSKFTSGIVAYFSETLDKVLSELMGEVTAVIDKGWINSIVSDLKSSLGAAEIRDDVHFGILNPMVEVSATDGLKRFHDTIETIRTALNLMPDGNAAKALLYEIYQGLPEAMKPIFLQQFSSIEDGFADFLVNLVTTADTILAEDPSIANQFADAQIKWNSLVTELGNTDDVTRAKKIWEELGDISSTWSVLSLIAAKNGWALAESIGAVSDGWVKYLGDAAKAAKDAASAAQDAFRDQFKKPILEGVRSGDWKAAADAIVGFAQSGRGLMEFAGNLSAANDVVIDEVEVLGMIVGASGELMSAIDNMILMGEIAGDDVGALELLRWAIEGVLDPLKQFKRELLESIIVNPGQFGEAYGGRLRAMIPKMASGGRVDTEGYAYLHEGEDVIPASVSALSTPMDAGSACSGGVCPTPDNLFDDSAAMIAQAAANVVASFDDVTSAAELNATSSSDVVFGFEKFSEELGYVLDSFSVVEGWASDMESVGLYEQANYLSDALKIARDGFIEAVSGMSAMMIEVRNSLKELATSISGIVKSAFKNLFRSLFDLSSSAEDTASSLNVPTGYKVERAAWAAATPGEPGDPMGVGEGFSFADWAIQLGADILGAITDAFVDFAWENFIEPWLSEMWGDIIASPFWQDFIIPVVWEEWIKGLLWEDFIVGFLWEDVIVGFLWGDVIKPFLWEPIIAPAITWITNFVVALTSGTATIAGFGLAVAGVMILLAAIGAIIGIVIGVLAFLWGAIQGIGDLLTAFFKPIIEAVGWAWEALTPLIDGARKLFGSLAPIMEIFGEIVAFGIQLITPLFSMLGVALQLAGDVIWIFAAGIKLIWDYTLGPVLNFLADAVSAVANVFIAVYNVIVDILNFLNPFGDPLKNIEPITLPSAASGAYVAGTGAVLVHAGEVIAPADTSPLGNYGNGGMMIDNTIMLDGSVLYQSMKRVNKQEELRRTGSSVGSRAWSSA